MQLHRDLSSRRRISRQNVFATSTGSYVVAGKKAQYGIDRTSSRTTGTVRSSKFSNRRPRKRVANAQNVLSQECYQKNAADLGNGQTEYVSRSQQLDEDGFNRLRTNDARISTNEVYRFQSVVRLEGLRCSSINKNLERDSGSETTAKTHFSDLHISIPRCKVKRRQSGCVGGVDICPLFHECLKT